jgi:hypothetical protein
MGRCAFLGFRHCAVGSGLNDGQWQMAKLSPLWPYSTARAFDNPITISLLLLRPD